MRLTCSASVVRHSHSLVHSTPPCDINADAQKYICLQSERVDPFIKGPMACRVVIFQLQKYEFKAEWSNYVDLVEFRRPRSACGTTWQTIKRMTACGRHGCIFRLLLIRRAWLTVEHRSELYRPSHFHPSCQASTSRSFLFQLLTGTSKFGLEI